MHTLARSHDPSLLVGPETSDDAGVYRISANLALVETVDIITPLVDDPFLFGRIAAANALSDVYAMGASPVTAMNLVFFPSCDLPAEILGEILAGGGATLQEAGVCLVGGHSVDDDQLKYGLSVTGLVDPERVVRNSTARPGDLLFLTKPLGTGIVSTAIKAEMVSMEVVEAASAWMLRLNREASEVMVECEASAATDVTGFGLIGHACEMARGAGVTLRMPLQSVPVMAGVKDLIRDGLVPAGCYRNRDHFSPLVAATAVSDQLLPLYDPQTSGGLLVAVAPARAEVFLRRSEERAVDAWLVGEVLPQAAHPVEIV